MERTIQAPPRANPNWKGEKRVVEQDGEIFRVITTITHEYDAEEYLRLMTRLDHQIEALDAGVEEAKKDIEEVKSIKGELGTMNSAAEKLRAEQVEKAKKEREEALENSNS